MNFKYLIVLIGLTMQVRAQSVPAIWYFGNYAGIRFTSQGPENLSNSAMRAFEGSAVQVDQTGQLLFYTNGETIFDRNHTVMENGEGLAGQVTAQQSSIIIPYPDNETKFYVFVTGEGHNGISYSVVDIEANDGLGKVVEKNTLLHQPSTEGMTAIGNCACNSPDKYWLLSFKSSQKDSVYAYNIDKNGLNKTAVRSHFKGIGSVDYVKFSPKGDLIAFLDKKAASNQVTINLVIAKFDFNTGAVAEEISHTVLNGNLYYSSLFFSPNGEILYVNINHKLTQYKVSDYYYNLTSIPLEPGLSPRWGLGQIGPDGKIYIAKRDEPSLTVIHNPNEWGDNLDVEINGLVLEKESLWGLPHFPEQLGYNGVKAVTIKDTTICSDQNIKLSEVKQSPENFYSWWPETHLDNPTVSNPIFNYVNTTDKIKTFDYILTVTDEYCSRCDTVSVSVLPLPDTTIYGPRSACPGVEEVEYSVVAKEGFSYKWKIEGGMIAGPDDQAFVKVNWGETNNNAKVELSYSSPCTSGTVTFPVRINVELKTDLPEGENLICRNLLESHRYSVPKSPGSTYTWGVEGGEIISGNMTNSILINFQNTSQAKVWVEENTTTKDTVCYGVSDTLVVNFYEDTLTIKIEVASVDLFDENTVIIDWKGKQISDVLQRSDSQSFFTSIPFSAQGINRVSVEEVNTASLRNEFKIRTINSCQQYTESEIHKVIWLKSNVSHDSLINLEWTAYEGWDQIAKYEIWRKIDDADTFDLFKTVDGNQTTLAGISGIDGFSHKFRVRGISSKGLVTFSNSSTVEFKHPLFIPNIFTPNNDLLNDSFFIKNLELYPDNELTIFNRWGDEVYKKINYGGEWKGHSLPSGIYFYSLVVRKLNKNFKGWLQITY